MASNYNSKQHRDAEEGRKVFLSHVPDEISEDKLKSHFGRFGLVTDVFVSRQRIDQSNT